MPRQDEAPGPAVTEAQLRLVLDTIPSRVVLIDRAGRHRYANQAYCDRLGRPAADILGRSIREVIGEDTYSRLRPDVSYDSGLERALAGETVHWQGWLEFFEGRRFDERIYFPCVGDNGEIDGSFCFARDLTDLKQSEEKLAEQLAALQASEARNTAITASALDCILAIDEAGLVVEFNPAAERTFGYTRAEAIGRSIIALIVPPDRRQALTDRLADFLATGQSDFLGRRVEMEAMRSDGSILPIEVTTNETRLPGRRLFTAYLRDLSPARAAEAEIQRQREALHQSEKLALFGSLLAGVAHELNNPLSIVIGNALMLAEDAEAAAPDLSARAQLIQAAAERCGRITHSFLAMARQHVTQPGQARVQALVDGALQLLSYGLHAAGVELELEIPADLPPVSCDAGQMTQVLTNLLVNARHALEDQPGPRRIRIAAGVSDAMMEIRVSDNGPGVVSPNQSRVFDPFFTTKPIGSGTGIGLSVSRGFVEAHGGSLTLAPPQGAGATFVVRLPLAAEVAPSCDAATPASASGPAMPTRRILIVDDEPEVGMILSYMIGAEGFDCDITDNGHEAKERLLRTDYDMVLCDLRMPEVDGPALFAWMTTHLSHLCDRTAFVTGDALGEAAGQFLARSGRPVLEKPFLQSDIRRLIAEVLVGT